MELTGVLSMLPNILEASLRESLSSKIKRVVEVRRPWFVETDVSHTSDAQYSHINSAETFNALLVQAAIFEYGIFGDGPVGAEYVLHIDVYVVEQHFFQCIKIAVDCIRCQWVIFIKVEHYYITEAQPFFFVHAHEG